VSVPADTHPLPGISSSWAQFSMAPQWSAQFVGMLGCYVTCLIIWLGLIWWGIVIHGFIDGYSRLITGLWASDNNSANTVFNLFTCAAQIYRVPSQMRGDHRMENLLVALFMEHTWGVWHGSYILERLE